MRDFINIGCSPLEEECVQVNSKVDYMPAMRLELVRFKELLLKKFGKEPVGAELRIKWYPHDFGRYGEIVCYYDDEGSDDDMESKSMKYAFDIEGNMPETWNDDSPFYTDESTTPLRDAIEANAKEA